MARKIQCPFKLLILIITLSVSANAQSKSTAVEQNVVIVLPAKSKLAPGSYTAEIKVSGESVLAQINVTSAQAAVVQNGKSAGPSTGTTKTPNSSKKPSKSVQDFPDSSIPPSPSAPGWIGIVLAAIVPIILIALGAWVYFKMILPRKQMKPYKKALGLISDQKYDEALPILTQVESKLPDELRHDARFFIAFANMQLRNIQDAEHILTALHRENPKNPSAAYLLAYIRVEGGRYDDAEPVLEKMESNGQLDTHHAKKLLGIVKFQRALAALRDRRVEAAGELFEKVQELGDFSNQIPADLRNRRIVLGTNALFDQDMPEARKQFESLQNSVSNSPEGQRDTLLVSVKLGLALVEWLENTPEGYTTIETLLVEAAKLLDPQGPTELSWPTDTTPKDVVEKLKDLDAEMNLSEDRKEVNQLLRDIHFLRGMTVLRSWRQMEGEAAHQAIKTQYESSLARFACSRARDEEFSDVFLVVGLLMYYFHKPGPERSKGIDLLQQSQKQGMRDPDAMEIINNRERIERANADAVDKYLQMLDHYLNDNTVRKEVRLALVARLAKFKRIQSWEKRPDLALARTVEPTVAEMRNRSEILQTRVDQILSSRGESEDISRVRDLSQAIMQDSQRLYEQAKTIEKNESELLAETGNQLFKDD
ncbi:MAG: tetratricopeptide repeat protein [bacterium]